MVNARLRRLKEGLFGDVKPLGQGLYEMRIDYGAGLRVYYVQRDKTVYIILRGGDKSTQQRDIDKARQIAELY
jgi:putative addiction module killer protein